MDKGIAKLNKPTPVSRLADAAISIEPGYFFEPPTINVSPDNLLSP